MCALIPKHLRNLPVWLSAVVWLPLLLSPTGYVLLLITLSRLQIPLPSEWFVVTLFWLIPVVALLLCGAVVWLSNLGAWWRVSWLVLTLLAILLQVWFLIVLIVSAITVMISPA